MMKMMLGLFLRVVLAVAIVAAGLLVGAQLRATREQLATGQAASAGTPPPTQPVAPAPKATAPGPMPAQTQPPTPPALRTVVPTPFRTPYTGALSVVTGTVTAGGKPVRGAQVMVYPSDSFNHGPTPVPPESAKATTDDRGGYRASVPPGAYRIGAFRNYDNVTDPTDGFAAITWYGDGYAIGLGKDLVVSDNVSADIAMLRLVRVAGRVVGRDGVGVPNAQVGLSRFYGGIDFPLVPLGLPLTDPTGAFNLSIAAMPLTLHAAASGPSLTLNALASMDLDLRSDQTDLILTIDRGNIVRGTLRDSAGRPLPNTNFGVWSGDSLVNCASCGGRSDGVGRFTITIPNGTIHFKNWPQVGEPELFSKDFVISGDLTLDPVLQVH